MRNGHDHMRVRGVVTLVGGQQPGAETVLVDTAGGFDACLEDLERRGEKPRQPQQTRSAAVGVGTRLEALDHVSRERRNRFVAPPQLGVEREYFDDEAGPK